MIVSPDQEQEQEKNANANRCENDAWQRRDLRSTRHHLMRGGNERHQCYNRGAYK
jgi:hypothetical protein